MHVAKWGNSLALRLPAALVKALSLKPGDRVDVRAAKDGTLEVARVPDRRELLARLRKYRGLIPADFKFDRDEINSRGR